MKFESSIKKHRIKKGLTQQELANRLFVTKQAISKWENNKGLPDASILPLLANELDTSIENLLGKESKKNKFKKRYLISIIISLLAICLIVVFYIYVRNAITVERFIRKIETQTDLSLPAGELVNTFSFSNWGYYGNEIYVDSMSYIVFKENRELENFESQLLTDNHWISHVTEDLYNQIPEQIGSYTSMGEYYLLFDLSNQTYNESMDIPFNHQYIFMVYQTNENRLIIFEYTITEI